MRSANAAAVRYPRLDASKESKSAVALPRSGMRPTTVASPCARYAGDMLEAIDLQKEDGSLVGLLQTGTSTAKDVLVSKASCYHSIRFVRGQVCVLRAHSLLSATSAPSGTIEFPPLCA